MKKIGLENAVSVIEKHPDENLPVFKRRMANNAIEKENAGIINIGIYIGNYQETINLRIYILVEEKLLQEKITEAIEKSKSFRIQQEEKFLYYVDIGGETGKKRVIKMIKSALENFALLYCLRA